MPNLVRKQYYARFWCANTGRLLFKCAENTRILLDAAIRVYRKKLDDRDFDYILQDDGDFTSTPHCPEKGDS